MPQHQAKLTLLTAPAGYGKTYYCLEQFKKNILSAPDLTAFNSFYIVPTKEHAERILDLIFRDKSIAALGRDYVTTFDGFVDRFMPEGDRMFASDVLKDIFLREILDTLRLDYFLPAKNQSGFVELLSDFIAEEKQSGLAAEDFCRRLKSVSASKKYQELERILTLYEKRLRSEGFQDVEDRARLFKEYMESNEMAVPLENVYLDGFFELTPLQFDMLKTVSQYAKSTTATVTADEGKKENRFTVTQRFLSELEHLGFKEQRDTVFTHRRSENPEMQFLSDHIFAPSATPFAGNVENIEMIEARNERGEIEAVAREIRKLYAERKYHFSDFCLIFRRIGSYAALIETVFNEFSLPVEIHERKMLRLDPLASSVLNLLDIFYGGWKKEAVLRFLHSSIPSNAEALCVLMERYAYSHNVGNGREAWTHVWEHFPNEKEAGRRAWLKQWADLEDSFRKNTTAKNHIEIVKKLINDFIMGPSGNWAEWGVAYPSQAHALRRFFEVLDELTYSFKYRGGGEVLFEEFYRLLKETVDVSLYSDSVWGKNRVQIYDISIARQKEYKVVFMCGLIEKIFPRRIDENALLKDSERRVINGNGREILAEQLPRQAIERYLFYLGITRAKEKLYLSYPRFGFEGNENVPSYYLEDVQRAFARKVPIYRQSASDILPAPADARTPGELERSVILHLFEPRHVGGWEEDSKVLPLFGLISKLTQRKEFLETIQAIYENELRFDWKTRKEDCFTDASAVKLLTGRKRPFAPTRLETYGACPFRYLLAHEVYLEEPDEELSPRTIGTIYHRTLEGFFKNKGHEQDLSNARQVMQESFGKIFKENPLLSDRPYRLELKKIEMEELLDQFLVFLFDELKHAILKPYLYEYKIGDEKSPFELTGSDNKDEHILVTGYVDRIDVDPEKRFAIIVDYKLSKKVKKNDTDYGLMLQLPLYVLAVEKNMNVKVIGTYFFRLGNLKKGKSVKWGVFSEEGLRAAGFGEAKSPDRKMLGASSRNTYPEARFRELVDQSAEWAKQYAKEIRKGKFPVYPKDCLSYCKFKSVCRIEKWMITQIQYELSESPDI